MATSPVIRVFEPALCCATGVCGPDLDDKLVRFTADIDYLKGKGVDIERHNLAVDPSAFAADETVRAFLKVAGSEGLPLTLVDGVTVAAGAYLSRERLARLAGLAGLEAVTDPHAAASDGADLEEDLCCTPEEAAATGCCSESSTPAEAAATGCCSGATAPATSGRADLGLTAAAGSGCC